MDAFKLLTRATSLQKTRPNSEHKSRLPSSGVQVNHQLPAAGGGISQDLDDVAGKKRKRGGIEASTQANHDASTGSSGLASTEPDEEECRRILKKHKLKVTLLDERTEGPQNGYKEAKTKKSKKNKRGTVFPRPLQSFAHLQTRYGVAPSLMRNLEGQGFFTPTDVQMVALPILLGDKVDRGIAVSETHGGLQPDLLTVAPTGSGKTLAFFIPIIQSLLNAEHTQKTKDHNRQKYVKAIILAPTHELVDQIVNEGKKLCAGTGLKVSGMQKGSLVAQAGREEPDEQAVIKADVLVSTPMMIINDIQHSGGKSSSLDSILHLVLDEADVLLDPLFREQTLGVWEACDNQALRVSFWSATIGASIESLTQDFIASRRKRLKIEKHPIFRLIVGLKDSSLPTIAHRMIYAATEQGKLLALRELLHPSTATASYGSMTLRPPFLVFTQTKQRAQALYSEMLYDIPPEAGGSSRLAVLHSDLSDAARSDIMAGFRKGEIWVIFTTDLLSRGIDFRGMNGVVNYDIPTTGASYVHRAGRTGRAGREGGIAVTLYTEEDIPYVKNIANVIAASEKAHGQSTGQTQPAMEKWLLDSLPKVGKQDRKELKKRGVAARRTTQRGDDKSREVRKARISTRSGYDRRLVHKRYGSRQGLHRETLDADVKEHEDGEWQGFD